MGIIIMNNDGEILVSLFCSEKDLRLWTTVHCEDNNDNDDNDELMMMIMMLVSFFKIGIKGVVKYYLNLRLSKN